MAKIIDLDARDLLRECIVRVRVGGQDRERARISRWLWLFRLFVRLAGIGHVEVLPPDPPAPAEPPMRRELWPWRRA